MKSARKPKTPVATEAEIQRSAIAILRGLGWTVLRRNTGATRATYKGKSRLVRFSEKGASDVYGITPSTPHAPTPRHFEMEVKRPGEWPTTDQILWLVRMSAAGAVAFWVSSTADLEMVARHVMDGGRVEFVGTNGQYRLVGGNQS